MVDIDWQQLFSRAHEVRLRAHAPYSSFRVGAALLTSSGRIFAGCNVENATFGLTICAERAALVGMVAAGETEPVALALVTPGSAPAMPCGMCRQSLAEFATDLPIHIVPAAQAETVERTSLATLLPRAFGRNALDEGREPVR